VRQHGEGSERGSGQHGEAPPEAAEDGDGVGDEQRSRERSTLVERLVQREGTTAPDVDRGVGEHGVAGGRAYRLAESLHHGQGRRGPERPAERQQRNGDHRDRISGER
jgi:hypothetical protein